MENKDYITINGKPFILYSGLLSEAHKKGIKSLKVEILQFPCTENDFNCIAKAILESKDDTTFVDFGDANLNNTSTKIIPHLLRLASTRSKARVLRDFCNIGVTSFEELNPDDLEENEKPTVSQVTLAKKLALETNMEINFNGLSKSELSSLISQMMENQKKFKTNLKAVT